MMSDYEKYIIPEIDPHGTKFSTVYVNALESALKEVPATPITDFQMFTQMTGGFRPNEFSILCGATGCISGDTIIRINRAKKGFKIRMQDLYERTLGIAKNKNFDSNIVTYVRSYDGDSVRLHKAASIQFSGIKEVWDLELVNGLKLRATPTHPVLTRRGFIQLWELRSDDFIAVDQPYSKAKGKKKKKNHDSHFQGLKYHPYASALNATGRKSTKRVEKHRVIAEANLNGLELNDFLEIIKNNKNKSKLLKYIDPSVFHVHHKNHNHYDNSVENLEILPAEEHFKMHGKLNYKNLNQGMVKWVQVKSTRVIGVEKVYDIRCEEPHHNFCANDIVVHNTGKTTFCANLSTSLLKQEVPQFIASVETGPTDYVRRIMSALDDRDLNTGEPVPLKIIERFVEKYAIYFEQAKGFISLHEDRFSVEELMSDIANAVNKHGIKIAIIDNLNFFLEVTAAQQSVVEMDRVVHELIIFAKKCPVHLIMIMHPKKTDHGRVESEFDIKGSSTAVQEAHNVFLFNRPSAQLISENKADPWDRELRIAKMRRRGRDVGATLIFESSNGVKYKEKRLLK